MAYLVFPRDNHNIIQNFSIPQAIQRDKIAHKFCQITGKIEAALSEIAYDKLDLSEEVREQVLLEPSFFFFFFCFWMTTETISISNLIAMH